MMNTAQKNEVADCLNSILKSLQILSPLMVMARDDIERRVNSKNSQTKELDQLINTPAGVRKGYVTVQIDPDSGYAVMSDHSMVTAEDMALAGDVLRRIQSQVDRAFDAIQKDERGEATQ
jgi:hypothetical protein